MESHDFGVCRLSVVPACENPDGLHQVTQLLFGEHYRVLERSSDKEWLKVQLTFDLTEGWINIHHHHSISQEFYEQIEASHFKIATDVVSTLLYKKSPISILMGSIVPISTSELFKMDEQFAFNGESKPLAQKRDREFLRTMAYRYLHAAEVRGGKNPFGICSQGFAQMVFKICGYYLPWDIQRMSNSGKQVKDFHLLQEGDLIFLSEIKNNNPHVGIALSDDRIIHCHGYVRIDHLMEDGIINSDTRIFTHSLSQIRRLI